MFAEFEFIYRGQILSPWLGDIVKSKQIKAPNFRTTVAKFDFIYRGQILSLWLGDIVSYGIGTSVLTVSSVDGSINSRNISGRQSAKEVELILYTQVENLSLCGKDTNIYLQLLYKLAYGKGLCGRCLSQFIDWRYSPSC